MFQEEAMGRLTHLKTNRQADVSNELMDGKLNT